MIVTKVREQSSNLLLTMAWSMFWGTALVLAWTAMTGQQLMLPGAPRYWAGLLYLSIFGSVIAFMAYFTLINRIGAQKSVYIGVVTPVISVLLSIRLEHYRPGPLEWLGMALCLASVAWSVDTSAGAGACGPDLNNPCSRDSMTLPLSQYALPSHPTSPTSTP